MHCANADEFHSDRLAFHRLGRQKMAMLRILTDFGFDVVLCDVDVAWLRDPMPFLSRCLSDQHSLCSQ